MKKSSCKWYKFQLHAWKPIYKLNKKNFEGSVVIDKLEYYQICIKCNTVREYQYDSQGGYHQNLRRDKAEIIKKLISKQDDYFVLNNIKGKIWS